MASRFQGGADVSRQAVLPATSPLTFTFWVQRRAASANATVVAFENALVSATSGYWMEFDNPGTALNLYDDTALRITGPTTTVDLWYFAAYVIRGTNDATMYWREERERSLSSASAGGINLMSGTPTVINVGGDSYDPADRLNGNIRNLKIWQASLLEREIDAESFSCPPVRRQDLYAWLPMLGGPMAHEDWSGVGRSLWVPSGTLTSEPDPRPVQDPRLRRRMARVVRTQAAAAPSTNTRWFFAAAAA